MSTTDGLTRGIEVEDTGAPISVPVGDVTLGRVFNVLGETIDLAAEIPASERRDPIHREAPTFENFRQKQKFLKQELKLSTYLLHMLKAVKSVSSVARV